jgi:hypothetical protein
VAVKCVRNQETKKQDLKIRRLKATSNLEEAGGQLEKVGARMEARGL